jgi:hypothetical protein
VQITVTTTTSIDTFDIADAADWEELAQLIYEISRRIKRLPGDEVEALAERLADDKEALAPLRTALA